ncbi:MAG: hypothetical protein RL559_1632 [Pseudomonadota bacterium]|jgi:hypothetical protein
MGIALLTISSLFQGFSALQHRLAPATRSAAPLPSGTPRVWRSARPSRHWPVSARPVTAFSVARPALRVVRVCDAQSRDAGRLVISGRMADVCAELERLAAREAAQHSAPLTH